MKNGNFEDSSIQTNKFCAHVDILLVFLLELDVIIKLSALVRTYDFSFLFFFYFCILLIGMKILHLFFLHNKFYISYYVPFEKNVDKYFKYLSFSLIEYYAILSLIFIAFFILNFIQFLIAFYNNGENFVTTLGLLCLIFNIFLQIIRFRHCMRLSFIKNLQKKIKK